jgi:ribulose 1,5-bisphosphate carboxylase large subunit-like protein
VADWIHVRGRGTVSKVNGAEESDATPDDIGGIARQVAADAVYGSFGDFRDEYWKKKWNSAPEDLVRVDAARDDNDHRKFTIDISINPALYDVTRGGLQHFLGVLAGDLFYLRIPGFILKDINVTKVEIPDGLSRALETTYRKEAYSTQRIRSAFQLNSHDALLAFSFKPRVGLKADAIREITLGVLDAGFHIVEFDTRYLDLSDATVDFLLELAGEAAQVGGKGRITRLSPNLSVAAPLALDLCHRFGKTSDWPYIVKVDGGFDGLSTVQEIRRQFAGTHAPIITCYPLLRDQLASKIPPDTFVAALAQSGVDIVYPGKGPSVGKPFRELGQAESEAVGEATRRYRLLADKEWPMISLAGGVYAGQLHALFELVGPKVAYFLGGAVSLHRRGPVEGARLCSKVLAKSAKLHCDALADVADLPGELIKEIEEAYDIPPGIDKNTFHYVPPRDLKVEVPRW